MHPVDVDLGSLELESNVPGLLLQLSSVARFAPSAKDVVDTLQEELTHENLSASSRNRPWITRGNSFRLELSLKFEPFADLDQNGTLIETLTARLRIAKVALRFHDFADYADLSTALAAAPYESKRRGSLAL